MATVKLLRRQLGKGRIWRRIFMERLTEPLHLNFMSAFVAVFGSYSSKIKWDLIVKQPYAYGALEAAELAKQNGFSSVTLIEFGVASGAGLTNLASIARKVSDETGVSFYLHGFDTGSGMPPAVDFRDHPDLYQQGDFQMDAERLRAVLPDNVTLHLGPLSSTIPAFLQNLDAEAPIGFVSIDVDYYSSTVEVLEVFKGPPICYLPLTVVYADDITLMPHNSKCGETLAFNEFNTQIPMRQLERHDFFENRRIFRRAVWVKQIFFLHVLDHPRRSVVSPSTVKRYIENPYLESESDRERFFIE